MDTRVTQCVYFTATTCMALAFVFLSFLNEELKDITLNDDLVERYRHFSITETMTISRHHRGSHLRIAPQFEASVVIGFMMLGWLLFNIYQRLWGPRPTPYYQITREEREIQRAVTASLEEEVITSPTNVTTEDNDFEKRLAAASYKGEIPDYFQDPVTATIMTNPVITLTKKQYTARTFDKSTLLKLKPLICPITRDVILGYVANRELKDAIEAWVKDKEGDLNRFNREAIKQSFLRSQTLFNQRLEGKKLETDDVQNISRAKRFLRARQI